MTTRCALGFVGVDPGLRTGVVSYIRSWANGARVFEAATLDAMDAVDYVEAAVSVPGFSFVICCERYAMVSHRRPHSAQPDALEVTGALRWLARRTSTRFLCRAPGDTPRIGSAENLRRLGWWRGGEGHTDRAAGQLLAGIAELCPWELVELGLVG